MTARRAALLAAAALVSAALVSAALPAQAADPSPVRAAGVMQVVTSSSGTVELFLPADVTVPLAGGVTFAGAGRLVAVWLERRSADSRWGQLTSYRLPSFAGGAQHTFGSTPQAECTATPSERLPLHSDCTASEPQAAVSLPRGHYRLVVLADGAPLTITLRLRGLAGELTTGTTRDLRSAQADLPVLDAVADTLVTFGASQDLPGPVETLIVARADQAGDLRLASACRREDAGAEPLAFGPHCPGGSSSSFGYTAAAVGGGAFGSSSSSSHEHGTIGLGGSFTADGGVRLRGALGVWLQQPPIDG